MSLASLVANNTSADNNSSLFDRCSGDDVLPYFLKSQDDTTGRAENSPKYHSKGGEWTMSEVRYQNPLSKKVRLARNPSCLLLASRFLPYPFLAPANPRSSSKSAERCSETTTISTTGTGSSRELGGEVACVVSCRGVLCAKRQLLTQPPYRAGSRSPRGMGVGRAVPLPSSRRPSSVRISRSARVP